MKIPYGDSWDTSRWAPVIDGAELPAAPLELLRRNLTSPVPVLLGFNKDEGFMFMTTDASMNFDVERPAPSAHHHHRSESPYYNKPHPFGPSEYAAWVASNFGPGAAQFGGYRLDLGSAADYELLLRMLLKHKANAAYIPRVLVHTRNEGMSNASLKNRIKANRFDRQTWRVNEIKPRPWTLVAKPLGKLGQWFTSS